MLCNKGYVRDMKVKYGIKVVYEGLARYFELLPGAFHSFQDSSSISFSKYLNLSEHCSN